VLEGVDRGDPGEKREQLLGVVAPGSDGVGAFIERIEMIVGEELHGHRRDFAEFDGRMAIEEQGVVACGEGVEGVAAFVQQREDVAVGAGGVHKDEGIADFLERRLIAAGAPCPCGCRGRAVPSHA
jgi:hypothetical protein